MTAGVTSVRASRSRLRPCSMTRSTSAMFSREVVQGRETHGHRARHLQQHHQQNCHIGAHESHDRWRRPVEVPGHAGACRRHPALAHERDSGVSLHLRRSAYAPTISGAFMPPAQKCCSNALRLRPVRRSLGNQSCSAPPPTTSPRPTTTDRRSGMSNRRLRVRCCSAIWPALLVSCDVTLTATEMHRLRANPPQRVLVAFSDSRDSGYRCD